ncbi:MULTISPECIES: cold-shock protein [unclassified Rhizobium]|uniref:cold-shock protein n=1 Tax=unclassified Rhizobium TaxID=2613769 RepID=UPI0018EE2799
MSGMKYSIGDLVVMKADLTRLKAAPRVCRILSLLPSETDDANYQVRFTHESFERRISATEIEKLCTDPLTDQSGSASSKAEPWLKPLGKGTRKQVIR